MNWHSHGSCRGMDPDLFFPLRGEPTRDAKAVCTGCPVRSECLEAALAQRERYGIWGGVSERERRTLRRRLARGVSIDVVVNEVVGRAEAAA